MTVARRSDCVRRPTERCLWARAVFGHVTNKKSPARGPAGDRRIYTVIKRSGQEVAMSANGDRPSRRVGLVHCRAAEAEAGYCWTSNEARSGLRALQVGVQHF